MIFFSKNSVVSSYPLSLFAGGLSAVCWQSDYFFLLQLVALAPFFYAIHIVVNSERTFRKKLGVLFFNVFFFKTVFFVTTTNWLYESSPTVFVAGIIMEYLITALLLSILLLNKRINFFTIICLWILYEYLSQKLFVLSPFYILGYSWANKIEWIQYYSILGIEGGSVIILLVNYAVFNVIKNKKIKTFEIVVFVAFISLSIFSLTRFYLSEREPYEKRINISVIHTEIQSKTEKYIKHPEQLIFGVDSVAPSNSLVILPEVFFNGLGWVGDLANNKIVKEIDSLSFLKHQNYVLGAYIFSQTNELTPQSRPLKGYDIFYNTHNVSILLDDKISIKSKQMFIPFQEYVPDNFLSQWINKYVSNIGDDRKITVLETTDEFEYKKKRFGVLLCYESIYPLVVSERSESSDFMVIQANEEWHDNEVVSRLYLNTNKATAIQSGISFFRASNHGYSAIISPNGTDKKMYKTGKSYSFMSSYLPTGENSLSVYNNIRGYSYLICFLSLLWIFIKNGNYFKEISFRK